MHEQPRPWHRKPWLPSLLTGLRIWSCILILQANLLWESYYDQTQWGSGSRAKVLRPCLAFKLPSFQKHCWQKFRQEIIGHRVNIKLFPSFASPPPVSLHHLPLISLQAISSLVHTITAHVIAAITQKCSSDIFGNNICNSLSHLRANPVSQHCSNAGCFYCVLF